MRNWAITALVGSLACGGASSQGQSGTDPTPGTSSGPRATSTGCTGLDCTGQSTGADGTTLTSTTTQDESSTGAGIDPGIIEQCPQLAPGVAAGALAEPMISEASGLAASRTQPGVLWIHNDSGDAARVFAVDEAGALLGTFALADTIAIDWEDMTIMPFGDGDGLVLGDIGDNALLRPGISMSVIVEPQAALAGGKTVMVDLAASVIATYPDGAHNAETLMYDPVDDLLYVVTKEERGPSRVFSLPPPSEVGETGAMTAVATLQIGAPGLPGATLTTAGDIASDGSFVIIRTYTAAFGWVRDLGQPLAIALAERPCALPLQLRPQGETLAMTSDVSAYVTVSEGAGSTIWRYDRTR